VKTTSYTIIGLLAVALLFGCKKNEEKRSGDLKVQVSHSVDGKEMVWDRLLYKNEAENTYGIEKLQYYLSDLKFYGNGRLITYIDTAIYIDARVPGKDVFTIVDFPFKYIDSISFLIGVTPKYNMPGGLPSTMENVVMDWPQMMGGGYHFLKLEGRWSDGAQTSGFAMHLGSPGFQVQADMRCAYLHGENNTLPLLMTMNVNEWFRDPHVYDFARDGVYSMGDDLLMLKLQENGKDVFSKK
jgi:hypothetical protein